MAAISPLSAVADFSQLSQVAGANSLNSKAGEEFLTIFYKEMLKQAIKAPSLSYDPDNKDENSFFSAYNTDIMVEQFAKQLVKNQIARPGWLPAEEVK
jgi:Rod binding domain-containing protein